MAISSLLPASSAAASAPAIDKQTIATNFTTFLQLLTTQLKNQNPLDPLDTNQFTQQLVQFAQVEQQMKQNEQLTTLIALERTAQSTTALAFVGQTVAFDGSTSHLAGNQAAWGFTSPRPANATFNIRTATGELAYTGTFTVNPGAQNFVWDGRGNDGRLWPPGDYTLTITATDASGQPVAVSTEAQGVVDSVDLTQEPPVLSVAGRTYPLSKIKRLIRSGL
jgi:flagellar basal-body rod modification protein FlgD